MLKVFASWRQRSRQDCCFVMMPFLDKFDNVYHVVKRAAEDYASCRCVRADEIAAPGRITDDIYEHIQKAKFLVADITDQNANVYYEVGVAHGREKAVILLAQAASTIPFDVGGLRYLEYELNNLDALHRNLTRHIKETLQTVPDEWRTDVTLNGPDVRIVRLNRPNSALIDQPVRIRVAAKNFGRAAEHAYFRFHFLPA
jgi:hypothetical protein